MKKYLVLLIIPLLFFSISCNDDDSDDTSGSIIGTWELINGENTYSYGFLDPDSGNEVIDVTYTDDIQTPFFLTFMSDNTFERIINYSLDEIIDTLIGTYQKTGNILNLYHEGDDDIEFTITTLNSNDLFFNGEEYEENNDNNDTIFFYRDYYELEFSRLTQKYLIKPQKLNKKPHKEKTSNLFKK